MVLARSVEFLFEVRHPDLEINDVRWCHRHCSSSNSGRLLLKQDDSKDAKQCFKLAGFAGSGQDGRGYHRNESLPSAVLEGVVKETNKRTDASVDERVGLDSGWGEAE